MNKGAFDLDDLAEQLKQMQKLGGMGGVLGMLPGIGKIKKQIDAANLDDTHPEAPAGDHRLDDARPSARTRSCSTPRARSASRPAPAPRCRTSTSS